ncbi:STAS domain-containing protein [Gephyromycinifex aptenodytis]|uniref:STAS domain-containing protein n=1 Tax=Gephyromycinifex aptenodytis TaxID=2716227 RepID=UPI0014480467|nr:STAS domain-containing protein [Gephyromycinifex aptenodytis]
MTDLDVTSHIDNGTTVVEVSGDVDVYSAAVLRDGLDRLIGAGRTHFVLDLDGVTFLDSTGIGVLVGRLRRVRLQEGSIHVACSVPKILRVFSITGLDQVFPLHENAPAAIDACRAEMQQSAPE